MSQIDNHKIHLIRCKLKQQLNRREITALMEALMEDTYFQSGSEQKQRAANSYMKIAHGGRWQYTQSWKNN